MLTRIALSLGIAATAAASGADDAITPFSSAAPGVQLPAGWRPVMLPRLKPTALTLVADEGRTVLRARAEAAAGTAGYATRVEMGNRPLLMWRWKIDRVVAGADTNTKPGDDYAARVYVFFDVPASRLSLVDRARMKLAKAIYGVDIPAASICYVWDNRLPMGASRWSPYSDHVRTIVLRSGNAEAGNWVSETRDLDGDFQAAFGAGRPGPTPALTGLAVGNDTDQTKETATAWFGDFVWKARH